MVSLAPGDVVAGRYQTESLIGRGGMGAVFQARDLRTGRSVALKVPYEEYASDAGWRRRFGREARAAAAIRHPNIVEVLDVDVDGPLPFIAMELLTGETLGDLLTREETLSLERAAQLLIPVCGAVHAGHRAGVIHRDLKPENIFLAARDAGVTPFVLDFGIAKVTTMGQVTEAQGALTQTGTMLGTPHFMAPEQMLDEEEVDQRVDVWALGVILFYALTGQRPYAGVNLAQILKSVLTSTYARLDALVPDTPKDVVEIVGACLAVRKEARPDGVDRLAAVLARHGGATTPLSPLSPVAPVAPVAKAPKLPAEPAEPVAARVRAEGAVGDARRASSSVVRSPSGPARIVFGMVPQRDDHQTRVLLNDLCAYLGKQIDLAVVPHRSPSADALASALHAGRVHVAWTGALTMLLSEHMTEMVPILSAVREGVAFYHSVLFTPIGSSVRDLAGARGKRVAWVAPSSAAGYVVPRLSLARLGLKVDELFAQQIFAGSHANATRAVVSGQVDVASTYAIFTDGDPTKALVKSGYRTFDPDLEVRVLDTSGPIPSDLIVAAPGVPVEVKRAIAQALLRIAADGASKAIMTDLIGADDFTPFTPAVLREVRALVDVARASGALASRSG